MRNRLGRLIKRRTAPTSPLDVLVRPSGNRDIYVVSGGAKRRIPSMDAFKALGYDLKRVRVVPRRTCLREYPMRGKGMVRRAARISSPIRTFSSQGQLRLLLCRARK